MANAGQQVPGATSEANGRVSEDQPGANAKQEDEENEEETIELLSTKMLPLLKLAMKGESMHALVASAGKEVAVMLSRKPIPPARRRLLAERLDASGGVKFLSGHCALDPETRATTFVLLAEVAGMAKKLKRALLKQTGLKVNKVSCRGADGAADHDIEEGSGQDGAVGYAGPNASTDPAPDPAAAAGRPGASSAAAIAGLDAEARRLINEETDRIFYETHPDFPPGQKIGRDDRAAAEDWLAIRDGVMQWLGADPAELPAPAADPDTPNPNANQREQHVEQVEADLQHILKLTPEQVARLALFTDNKAMAEDKGAEKGADRLLEALGGKSSLGELTSEEKKALLHQFAVTWLYAPGQAEDGAMSNLKTATAALKGNQELASTAAEAFYNISISVPRNTFVGPDYDALEEERRIQNELWGAAIDLDPIATVRAYANGESLVSQILGQKTWYWDSRFRWEGNPDRYGQQQPQASEIRRNAVMQAVGNGALSPEETQKFFKKMFVSTSSFDVSAKDSILGDVFDVDRSTPKEQEAMAKLLGYATNQAHQSDPADAQATEKNLAEIMKSKGGREVLFTVGMPNEYRLWALDMMASDAKVPGKRPWTAKDLKQGWESPKVMEAYSDAAAKAAQKAFPEPWQDKPESRGMLTNNIGQILGIRPDKLPKDETPEQKKQRESQGFNAPVYDLDKEPMRLIMGHIGTDGKLVTAIPVTVMNREKGAALFQVLRVQKDAKAAPFFLDNEGHRYEDAASWIAGNELPPGAMTYPKELTLGNALETRRTRKDSTPSRAAAIADDVAFAAGAVAGLAILIGSGGTAAPLVAGGAALYTGGRGIQKLSDLNEKGHSLSDVHDDAIRGAYIDVASNAFAVASMGATKFVAATTAEGAKVSRAGATLIAGLTWAGNVTDMVGIANQIDGLAAKWDTMDEADRAKGLAMLGFAVSMKAAQVRQEGGVREQFDFARIRNQVEHGTPFNVEKARAGQLKQGEKIAVINDNGKMTIVYEGEYPTRQMLALHSDAAVSMEATYTLKEKLKRMMDGGDPDKPPPGSVAWEAVEELKKIRAELAGVEERARTASEDQKAALYARQIELNEAILKENAKLDFFDQQGKGYVASPRAGRDQAAKLGWDKVELPKGYEWVAGDIEPHIAAEGKPRMYWNEKSSKFIPEKERARLEKVASKADQGWFEKTFDTRLDKGAKPLKPGDVKPDVEINATKGGMPKVEKTGKSAADNAQALADAMGLEPEQMDHLVDMMGKKLSKNFGKAWAEAVKNAPVAKEALERIRTREKLAAVEESKGNSKKAQQYRDEASKLGKEAYDPVRGEFWKAVYANKDMRAEIEAAGLTFDEGKAPYLLVPDPAKPGKFIEMQVTLEHAARKSDVPSRAQDPDNLLFSFRYENTVLLEHIRRIVRNQMGVNPGKPHPMN
jgi:hypothetical protein